MSKPRSFDPNIFQSAPTVVDLPSADGWPKAYTPNPKRSNGRWEMEQQGRRTLIKIYTERYARGEDIFNGQTQND